MAEFTYETRRKITENWVAQVQKRGEGFSKSEKSLLPERYYYSLPKDTCRWMSGLLSDGTYWTLSELYKKQFSGAVEACVPQGLQEEFYYALDQMKEFQYTAGWFRRSMRAKSYAPFAENSVRLLRAYSRLQFYGADFADILTGQVEPEIYDHARTENWYYSGILAAQIDRGNEKTIQAVKDILLGEGNTAMISYELIRGIVMSKSRELYELLGKFLLAARLQEGARQAVCETMDAGRPEAFLYLFSVIEENNLVRYSSVKRAVSTWIGIFDEKSVDRITEKLVRLMGQCLRDEIFMAEQLATNDSVAISCALWAKGFYDAEEAIAEELELIRHGTKNQKMTASYFNHSLQRVDLRMKAAKEVILSQGDDIELAACFMPDFMGDVGYHLSQLIKHGENGYVNWRNVEIRAPKEMEPTELFDSREEAKRAYDTLKEILSRIPKKGIILDPCIFPWHQVTMSQSDIAIRMCLIAWMLREEERLDEAAELIPLIGQGGSYSTSRSAAAQVLCYRPTTERRKAVLFELLHNPEEYTLKAAYHLVDDMELTAEDFVRIEQNLKYKKGRSGTLALLRKQSPAELKDCIGRLLESKSEECHMGALDLALEVKKEKPEEFEAFRPVLAKLAEPTSKEQVLLEELLGAGSAAQDILNTPGYGLYNPDKEWVLPEMKADGKGAAKLFTYGEKACIGVLEKLNRLIEENRALSYKTAWGQEQVLGTKLDICRWIRNDPEAEPLDAFPFRELWEDFYQKEIRTPELLMELYLYQCCRAGRSDYESNVELYRAVFGSGILKKPPFQNLVQGLRYGVQAGEVIKALYEQFVPNTLKAQWALAGIAKLVSELNTQNDLFEVHEKRYNGTVEVCTKRATQLPVFEKMIQWLGLKEGQDWDSAFTLRFWLGEYYSRQKDREKGTKYLYTNGRHGNYLGLADYVQCCVRGIWDKDLFYKAVFQFLSIGSILGPCSTVAQKGAVPTRKVRAASLNNFFGWNVLRPVDGKYNFDAVGEEVLEMKLARDLYREVVPVVLAVELKRGEQPTVFSQHIKSIQVVYGIDYMIQILTALGKDTLQRGYSYYASGTERKTVLSHLLKVCYPLPEETAADLKRALKGTDITKKRLVELSMYSQQWIPMVEEYLKLEGFQSGCYYFIAHTSERMDEFDISMVARYTPLSPEELKDGAFDLPWFFEAYGKLGEKNWKLLYDAAKYSSTGAAHSRARKYADAALGKVKKEDLEAEISAKRNKDLLMSIGLLPMEGTKAERENDLLERYQFIQKFKKESRQFGAQRRASEGRAVEIALRNLSVNAGYTDVTRLTLRMENKLVEMADSYFTWNALDEIELKIDVDENGKSSLLVRKGEKTLKSVPAKYKKDEQVLAYQETNKKLKEQYSRTRQMMEQAMEDRTAFSVWEFRELAKNPVVRPIIENLVVIRIKGSNRDEELGQLGVEVDNRSMGFLTESGLLDYAGNVTPVKPEDEIVIAHPYDLYQEGHWHEYQKLLFKEQRKQPFKQVFRELYVKLEEELDKEHSLMFAGNQIQPQKTVGALRSRRWVADYEEGLQKIYYKENIVARIYAMADWFSPSDVEAPTLEYVVFTDRKTFKTLKISEIPDIIYSEVMRDVDLAVSVAHAGGVDPETSHSTIEMRQAIVECNLKLFKIKNVRVENAHAIIDGKLGEYTVHLGSGVVHQMGNAMLFVVPVHSQHRGRLFLPFVDDDPKTAEIMSKILLFAEDNKIKDPSILAQIR